MSRLTPLVRYAHVCRNEGTASRQLEANIPFRGPLAVSTVTLIVTFYRQCPYCRRGTSPLSPREGAYWCPTDAMELLSLQNFLFYNRLGRLVCLIKCVTRIWFTYNSLFVDETRVPMACLETNTCLVTLVPAHLLVVRIIVLCLCLGRVLSTV